ncbi:glycosyltransferase [Bhargavaea massiliensis]|uniref:glycosyltransferase n=1 Tax=Bhargavaea massiliensis TaxID=2697500 RepID=UPI001BCF3E38|nr:glycosyltransferase [Bhargavaea massiliensis]
MKKQSLFVLTNSLDVNRGGLTKAVLAQTKALSEMGYDTYLLTFNFNTRYEKIKDELISLGLLGKNVKVLNLYESLLGFEKKNKRKKEPKRTGYLDKRKGHNAFREYENGLYVRYRAYHDNGSLNFIDYFNENRYRTKREVYDSHYNIRRVTFMDYTTNKPRQIIYYDNRGKAYLSKWINPETEKATRVNWLNKAGGIKATYPNDDALKVKWIQRVIDKFERPILISDSRATDPLMLSVKNNQAVKIWRLHSNHLLAPFEIDSDTPPGLKPCIEKMDSLDGILVLTNHQKQDMESRFGKKDNISVVPHSYETKISNEELKEIARNKDIKSAVVVSRLSGIKNIPHIIKAFDKVVKHVPDAKLDIWGEGNQEENLKNLIDTLGLNDNITLNGYTKKPNDKYQKALFSILTSKTEGFGLSILESMANATPVISYDIRYGAREMIDNEVNGFLIEKNNIEELANKMIEMFNDPARAIKMGQTAYHKIDSKFNKEVYAKNWKHAISNAIENKLNKTKQ